MEYNGVNSGDQTDKAEMLNSFFTEIGPSLNRDATAEKLINPSKNSLLKLIRILFLIKQQQHMFFHYYQSLQVKSNWIRKYFSETSKGMSWCTSGISYSYIQSIPNAWHLSRWVEICQSHCIKILGSALIRRIINQYQSFQLWLKSLKRIIYDQLYHYLTKSNFSYAINLVFGLCILRSKHLSKLLIAGQWI